MLFGGQQGRAPLVASGDEAEEEIRLHAVECAEADFFDDEQAAVEVALGP